MNTERTLQDSKELQHMMLNSSLKQLRSHIMLLTSGMREEMFLLREGQLMELIISHILFNQGKILNVDILVNVGPEINQDLKVKATTKAYIDILT